MTGAEFPTTIVGLVGMIVMLVYNFFDHRNTRKAVSGIDKQVNNRPNRTVRDDLDEVLEVARDLQARSIRQGKDVKLVRLDVNGLREELGTVSDSLQSEISRAMAAEAKLGGRL